jgi:transcriptional regulator with XRE-family HTH domain
VPDRGRPSKPPASDAPPAAARLAVKLRELREGADLTQAELAELIGCTPQHVSEVERARAKATAAFVRACEGALAAEGALRGLLPAALEEASLRASERHAARQASVRCAGSYSDTGDEDVEPTTRLGLLEAGAAAALGVAVLGARPARAGDVDPKLPEHWTALLALLGRLDAAYGPHEVLPVVERELQVIATHRAVARGELRTALMRVEARWAQFAAWLSNDAGKADARRTWADRARQLAVEVDYRDMVAFIYVRQSQWAAQNADAHNAIAFAQAALRVPGIAEQTRARSALRAAYGYALANDADACGRSLADAESMMQHADDLPVAPWVGRATVRSHVRPDEARCWLAMQPRKAIGLYEHVLRNWPRHRLRDRGLHQARLAVACAATGELDRAEAERHKALAITRTTKSSGATRELRRLGAMLRTA